LDTGAAKFDHKKGGHGEWKASVDRVQLQRVTPEKVQAWKVAFIKKANFSPIAEQSAKRTVNAYIRCSRSLFSLKTLQFVALTLARPLPFEGVEREKTGSMRYRSTIDVKALIEQAKTELKQQKGVRQISAFRRRVKGNHCVQIAG
jgi:hypothetical protein